MYANKCGTERIVSTFPKGNLASIASKLTIA